MKNKKLAIIIVLALLIIITGFLLTGQKQASLEKKQNVSVRLGWLHQGQFAGFYLAKEKGFYRDVGLEVTLLEADHDIDQGIELINGNIDFSIMEAHQFLDYNENNDLIALAAIYQVNPHVLAVREDSDIYSPKDFNGKIIGLSGGESEGDSIFKAFIKEVGVIDNVNFKKLGFNTIEDFKNNNADVIDIYSIDQNFLAEKENLPLRLFPLDTYGFTTYGDVIVAKRKFVEENPELVRLFVTSTLKGWESVLEKPQEAVDVSLKYTSGRYNDRTYQEHIIYKSIPLISANVTKIGEMSFVPFSTLYESMLRSDAITNKYDVSTVFTNEYIYSN